MKEVEVRKSLYLKYRPQSFEDLVSQEHIKRILKASSKNDTLSQGYLLVGPRGTGKTTTARLIAKSLNCTNLKEGLSCGECDSCKGIQAGHYIDMIEIDAASNTGVDDMRDLIEKANFAPTLAKKKVYIIDEVHMLSKSAFNALLKTLEEPPSHVHFILATTEVNKIPATIVSRCQRFDFGRISIEDLVKRLRYICEEEKVGYEEKVLEIIANNSDGGLRDAISLLEQVIINNNVSLENVEFALGIVRGKIIEEFVTCLLEKKTNLALNLISDVYGEGVNLVQFKKEVLEYLRNLILSSIGSEDSKEKVYRYLELIELINDTDVKNAYIPQFPLEVMVCKATLSTGRVIHNEESFVVKEDKKEKDGPKKEFPNQEITVDKSEIIKNGDEYKFTSSDLPDNKFIIKPTLEKIREDWQKIIAEVSKPTLKMSLADVFIEKYDNDTIELSVNSEFHYENINKNESKHIIEAVLKDYFSVKILVNVSLSKIKVVKKEEVVNPVEDMPVEEVQEEPRFEEAEIKPNEDEEPEKDMPIDNIQEVRDLFNS